MNPSSAQTQLFFMLHHRQPAITSLRWLVVLMLIVGALAGEPAMTVVAEPETPEATIPVTTCNASDLIAAINTANGASAADTITLLAGCTYSFSAANNYWYGPNALPPISSTITIEGNGAVLQNTNTTRLRFFYVGADAASTRTPGYNTPGAGWLTLRNLTLLGGLAKGGDAPGGGGGAGMGGAIFNQGTLMLEEVTLRGNTARGGNAGTQQRSSGGGMGSNGNSYWGGGFGGAVTPAGSVGGTGNGGGGGFKPTDNGGSPNGGGTPDGLGGRANINTGYSSPGNGSGGAGAGSGMTYSGGGFGGGGAADYDGGGGGVGGGGGDGGGLYCSGGGGGFGGGGGGSGYGGAGGFGGGAGPGLGNGSGDPGFGGGAARNPNAGGSGGGGAGMGGAIFNHGGVLTIINSTLAGNLAAGGVSAAAYGGSGFGGALFNLNGNVTIANSTLANNTVGAGSGYSGNGSANGGALYNLRYTLNSSIPNAGVTISNSILANTSGGNDLINNRPANLVPASGGGANTGAAPVSFSAPNLIELRADQGGATSSGTTPLTSEPVLGALRDNGGPAWTMALMPGSPAIDAGNACLSADQRGVARPQIAACDIGAFESRGFNLTYGGGSGQSTLVHLAFSDPLSLMVSSSFGEPVDGGQVVLTGPGSGAGINPTIYTATISSGAVTQIVRANSTPGSYTVSADMPGNLGDTISFSLTNLALKTIVQGNAVVIADGDATPATIDGTDFGNVMCGSPVTHTFVVSNSSAASLTVNNLSLSGAGAAKFTINGLTTPMTLSAHTTAPFQVRFDPLSLGTRVATVTLTTDEGLENAYDFAIQAVGVCANKTVVLGNGGVIADGDTTPSTTDGTDYGNLTWGVPVTHTFVISNSSSTVSLTVNNLNLSGAGAAEFTLSGRTTPMTLSAHTTATFQVGFDPISPGTRAATITLTTDDLTSDGGDENVYDFAIQGMAECSHHLSVTNSNDAGAGSLRQAIALACDGGLVDFAGNDTIYLNSTLTITRRLTIDSSGHTITLNGDSGGDGSPNVRIFYIGSSGIVTLTYLNIVSGTIADNGGGIYNLGTLIVQSSTLSSNSSEWGGGIYNGGMLTVQDSTLSGNSSATHNGGGIYNSGTLTVRNSTFSGNSTAYYGGGLFSAGTLTVQNSTFSGNSAGVYGGGLANYGTSTIRNSTLSGNLAGVYGGGIFNVNSLHLYNTLIANSLSGGDCRNGGGTINTNDHNLIEDDVDACGLTNGMGGSLIGVDPQLAPLGNYGGATQTFALLPDSPAIDAGNAASCLASDQRGQSRDDLQCDIGAYELKYPDSPTVIRSVSSTITTTFGPTLVGLQRDAGFIDPGIITVTKESWNRQGIESIGALWSITPTVTSGFSLTLQLCYTNAELGSLTESALRFYRAEGITYTQQITAPVLSIIKGYHCATLSGIDQLSRWTLATDTPTAITLDELSARASIDAERLLEFVLLLSLALIIGGVWFKRQTRQR